MKKRVLSALFALVMIFALMPTGASAAATYSVDKAIAYAKAHWNDGEGACATFVSRCVIAGGINIKSQSTTRDCYEAVCKATGLPQQQLKLNSSGYATKALDGNILAAGDIVFQYCNTHKKSPHILLCGGYNSNGIATFYAHNSALNNKTYKLSVNTAYEHTTSCDMVAKVVHISSLDNSKNTYTMSFSANGGSGSIDSIKVKFGQEFTLPANTFTNSGSSFAGWNVCRDADGKWYVTGKGWVSQSDITANGYEKKVYGDGSTYTFNNSWTDGYNGVSGYTFFALWEKDEHTHEYTGTYTDPTCTEDGYFKYTCSCGYSYNVILGNALGHSYENGICTRCGEKDPDYEPAAYPFTDVDVDGKHKPFADAILWAANEGITTGYGNGIFKPDKDCTRAQVVTFLWRAAGEPTPKSTDNPFVDVSAKQADGKDNPFYTAILWAVGEGITLGFDKTHFAPDATVTRAQFVTFLWRYEGKPAAKPGVTLTDLGTVTNADFRAAILWAAGEGITTGYSDGSFRPNTVCTRAHVVTFIYRDMN